MATLADNLPQTLHDELVKLHADTKNELLAQAFAYKDKNSKMFEDLKAKAESFTLDELIIDALASLCVNTKRRSLQSFKQQEFNDEIVAYRGSLKK